MGTASPVLFACVEIKLGVDRPFAVFSDPPITFRFHSDRFFCLMSFLSLVSLFHSLF